ncbi:hypothetical protein TNCV_26461 [Trichonephila clavipes]|uniref:Uncharacterized protein n=1 Tax=Trichonephila clavipes TaxID=2585209 RepID=A0A8X6WJU4_TRICX|nr:hypothetical protein TNCV_26461 [Trichonephila clavipes]
MPFWPQRFPKRISERRDKAPSQGGAAIGIESGEQYNMETRERNQTCFQYDEERSETNITEEITIFNVVFCLHRK